MSCTHKIDYDQAFCTQDEVWFRVESRHSNGLMLVQHIQAGDEYAEEVLDKAKNNAQKKLEEEFSQLQAESFASKVSEDVYADLPTDFADSFTDGSTISLDKDEN